jgi:hypothetical protein
MVSQKMPSHQQQKVKSKEKEKERKKSNIQLGP